MKKILVLDSRRRANFARLGKPEHTRYIVDQHVDGSLTLTPAVVVPVSEAESNGLKVLTDAVSIVTSSSELPQQQP